MDTLKVTTEDGKIQVRIEETTSFELLDTWNNRKVLMIILRLIRGEDGRPLLTFPVRSMATKHWPEHCGNTSNGTFQEIAEAFGYPDRRNVPVRSIDRTPGLSGNNEASNGM